MQDWPLEVADASRVGEFLELFGSETLSPEEKFALMSLVICSFDELEGEVDPGWQKIRTLLIADAKLFASLIVYWSCLSESKPGTWHFEPEEHCFHLTSKMRGVLQEVRADIGLPEISPEIRATK